ncbi:MAG: hypothetical protein ACSHW7_04145 [Patiriisocius sp.]|uniref:hypothetical protein n=1 Tax=Patiriisocius sp. TaxID=2822396 RepID=UPI003EF25B95
MNIPTYLRILALIGLTVFISCEKNDESEPMNPEPEPSSFLGEVEYIKTYGGSGIDTAVDLLSTSDGGYMIIGNTESNDGDVTGKTTTDRDYWLLKLNADGTIDYTKIYGGSADDTATAISKTSDGGYIVSGYTRSNDGDVTQNQGFHDYWIVKLNSLGDLQWQKSFGFPGSDQAFKIIETSTGNYFVTGFLDVTASNQQGNDGNGSNRGALHGVGEFWGILLDNTGTTLWRRYFGGSNNDRSYDALETADGGILMVGSSESNDFDITDGKGSYDFWAVRLTPTGDIVWAKSFGGSEIDNGYALTMTTDGNYMMVGDTRSSDFDVTNPKGNADAWVIKFDDNGNIIWQKTYGGPEFDSARSVTKGQNGTYIISGNTRSSSGDVTGGAGQNDAWVFVIDESGAIQFQKTIGGTSLDFAEGAIQTQNNEIIFVGNTESNDADISENKGIKDALIIKIK